MLDLHMHTSKEKFHCATRPNVIALQTLNYLNHFASHYEGVSISSNL